MNSATDIIAEVKETICKDYCKYKEQCEEDENNENWDAIEDSVRWGGL